jgi:hypothetical protein
VHVVWPPSPAAARVPLNRIRVPITHLAVASPYRAEGIWQGYPLSGRLAVSAYDTRLKSAAYSQRVMRMSAKLSEQRASDRPTQPMPFHHGHLNTRPTRATARRSARRSARPPSARVGDTTREASHSSKQRINAINLGGIPSYVKVRYLPAPSLCCLQKQVPWHPGSTASKPSHYFPAHSQCRSIQSSSNSDTWSPNMQRGKPPKRKIAASR